MSSRIGLILCCLIGSAISFSHHNFHSLPPILSSTRLEASRRNIFNFFRRRKAKGGEKANIPVSKNKSEEADVIVIGGGISGLTAAKTAAENKKLKVILLESSPALGGRVQSEVTEDGFTLDKGFAVFIDQYPEAQKILDFEDLKLKPFLPGALIKLKSKSKLARVADPLREPEEIFGALTAPIGSLGDKLNLLPLILNVRSKSVEELFEERDTDTLTALSKRWGFSEEIIVKFFKPFLEGIYLAPLEEQSSRMFSFVLKMFSEGSATLPENGIGAVSDQLVGKAKDTGVDILTSMPVTFVGKDGDDDAFVVKCDVLKKELRAKTIVVATDGQVAQKLLSNIEGFYSLKDLPEQPQRSVGCMYYTFSGDAPVDDPILILNGIEDDILSSDDNVHLVNNVCFPSVVNEGYAPEGYSLCSVTILEKFMKEFEGRPSELDSAVREQLSSWFPEQKTDILEKWELKKTFHIPNAQPAQYKGPFPASVNGGRPSNTFRNKELPTGIFVCGDHMATATLNGALESGVNAGKAAAKVAAMSLAQ